MRNNQPVTQREYSLKSGSVLVSRTNAKGQIDYANEDFYTAAGFAQKDIINQPHNIIRHPDMPAEAFRDLWETLKRGRPWSGLVKNRRQNGDHYWVRANVNPHSNGGYRSVRVAPSKAEITSAEALYAQMRADNGITLHEGRVFQKGTWTNIKLWAERITISQRMLLMGGIASVVFLISISMAYLSLTNAHETLLAVQNETLLPNVQVVNIQHAVAEKYNTSAVQLSVGITILSAALVGGLISLVIGVMVFLRLKRGFASTQAIAQLIADGDLTSAIPLEGSDEIGHLVAQITIMRNNLQELIGDLGTSLEKLAVDSRELRNVAAESAEVANGQSESSTSIAAAVEELSVSIDQVEEHASEAYKITKTTSSKAIDSAAMIDKIATSIQDIATSVQTTASEMRSLEQISNQISSIVKVISEVADQTNLLALNAAIEAARAGEQGRGFAVVADEVRKLAEKTNRSSKEITQMISNIQNAAHGVVMAMENGVERVNLGVTLSRNAAESMVSIRTDQTSVTQVVDGIAGGLSEQATATRDIAVRIEEISQGTEKLAGKARQTNESAKRLEELTAHLRQLAANFRVV
ncbi:PAS domain-containing methyl-accepting chemotaxis protein [Sideroxydans sp. CL21]|uniref:methyl-accepting chemotaxis protein n=1 Tax=Sideroxydans sp. CL21 TaxID=2600596 RepID=UPI0024BCE228|nr:PAS domain-containing methyl-accepting chemotaxis protein [Sideroxydans sp. CL21]